MLALASIFFLFQVTQAMKNALCGLHCGRSIGNAQAHAKRMESLLGDITRPRPQSEIKQQCTDTNGNQCCRAAFEKPIHDMLSALDDPFPQEWWDDFPFEYQNYQVNRHEQQEQHFGTGIRCRVKYGFFYHNFDKIVVPFKCSGSIRRQPVNRVIGSEEFSDTCAFCDAYGRQSSDGASSSRRLISSPLMYEKVLYQIPIEAGSTICHEIDFRSLS